MKNYPCPDCKDGSLEAKVREVDLELEEGETAEIVGGLVLVTSVGCDNGCEAKAAKPNKKKDRTPAAAAGGACSKSDLCSRPDGHTGRHDTKLEEHAHA